MRAPSPRAAHRHGRAAGPNRRAGNGTADAAPGRPPRRPLERLDDLGRSYPDAIPPLRELVDGACAEVGRDPATLGRTVAILAEVPDTTARLVRTSPTGGGEPLAGTAEEMAAALRGFAAEGIAHVQLVLAPNSVAGIEAFAPVLEALDRA